MIGWIILDSCIENVKVISKTFEFDWRAVWGWKGKCPPKHRLRLQNQFFLLWRKLFQRVERRLVIPVTKKHVWTLTEDCKINFFFTLEKAVPEGREKASNPGEKETRVNVHRRLRNQFFFLFLIYNFGDGCTRESRKGYSSQSQRSMCVCNI